MEKYRELMSHLMTSSTESAPQNVAQQVNVLEGQLTWLTYICGAIVGGHSWSSSRIGNGEETLDASLSKRVLQLAQGMDFRLTNSNGVGKADVKLEMAMLYYFQNFRRVYMFMWEVRYMELFDQLKQCFSRFCLTLACSFSSVLWLLRFHVNGRNEIRISPFH